MILSLGDKEFMPEFKHQKKGRKTMYKVVDIFNGWESEQCYETEEQANKELARDKQEFEDNLLYRDCIYCKKVVPVDAERVWNGYEWEWKY